MGNAMRIQIQTFVIVWILAVVVAGCAATVQLGRGEKPPQDAVSSDATCRIYLRDPYLAIPDLPDLKGMKHTSEELNLIQANYIRELRQFIVTARSKMDEDYNEYVKRCLK